MTTVNAVAVIDEAGEKGYVRNLDKQRDDAIGLLGALVFPKHRLKEFRAAFAPPFERFKTEGGSHLNKLHITEAFKPGNEALRPMAVEVRNAVCDLVRSMQVPVVYCARRMRLPRETHQRVEDLKHAAKAARRATHISIPDRPSTDRVEEDLMIGLALRLDEFAAAAHFAKIELVTDDMDRPILNGLRNAVDLTRSISSSETVVKAFNRNTGQRVEGKIRFSVPNPPFELNTQHLGGVGIAGKDDPLVFATDVVVNALADHLMSLPSDRPLNAPSSIAAWNLRDGVWGVADGMAEDQY